MTARADPQTPAWVLDIVETQMWAGEQKVIDHMLACGEDVSDVTLWRHRRSQFFSLLAEKAEQRG
jgi:hypothetical protein